MANFHSNMYGPSEPSATVKPTVAPAPVVPKAPPPAHQRLSGLKLTNSHMHEVEINGKYVTIPSAAYIKLLEDQIKEFRSIVNSQTSKMSRLTNVVNKLHNDLDRLKASLGKRNG